MIIDAELEICPAYGWQGGPEFNTLIKQMRTGHERRRPLWEYAKHRFALPFQNITNDAYLMHLKSIFLAARGSAYSFLVKDASDFAVEQAAFGTGDGAETEFPLSLRYQFGPATYVRRVLFPVNPKFYVGGTETQDAVYDDNLRMVVFGTAPSGALSWSGEHRVLVRFESDALPMTINTASAGKYRMSGAIELIEVWDADDSAGASS
jgi:uncharacterized protein (TIGR02217 family)